MLNPKYAIIQCSLPRLPAQDKTPHHLLHPVGPQCINGVWAGALQSPPRDVGREFTAPTPVYWFFSSPSGTKGCSVTLRQETESRWVWTQAGYAACFWLAESKVSKAPPTNWLRLLGLCDLMY